MTEKDLQQQKENTGMPPAPTGNASNPSASGDTAPQDEHQLLGARAEKYLRESASIEDMPDDEDWQEADDTLRKEDQE